MTYDMSLHTFEPLSCSQGSTRTHRRKPSQRAQAAESPSPPKVWVSTASSWSMCAPSRCKRTRHLKVKRKSRPALCVSTAKRCCCHQDGGRGRVEGHLQEGGGGGSPEDGHVLEGPAGQPRWWSSSRLNLLERGCRQQAPASPPARNRLGFRGVQTHGKKFLGGVEKGRVD